MVLLVSGESTLNIFQEAPWTKAKSNPFDITESTGLFVVKTSGIYLVYGQV